MADSTCYDGGSIAGAVIGTLLATVLLGVILLVLWNRRKKKSNPLHDLVLIEGDERGGGNSKNFVYDNVGFLDDTTDPKKGHQTQTVPDGAPQNKNGKMVANPESSQNKKTPWGPFGFLFNRNSRSALDDSVLEEPQRYSVALKGHDFTGLGFNVCGSMRDGVYVKDVMQRGPAAESKRIMPGDRITALTVSFKHMVLEDALTILSYASPYEVELEMMRFPEKSLLHKGITISSPSQAHSSTQSGMMSNTDRICHPFFKSQSIDDLRKVGKEHLDLKVDQVLKKQVNNGVKASGSVDVPTVVLPVPDNENRSPSIMGMGFMKGGEKNASEAHQEEKQRSNKKTMSPSLDEVDTCRAPIVQEIKVSAFKPEVVPRAKSKTQNVRASSAATSTPIVVEAISPVIKMAYEQERRMTEAVSPANQPSPAILHVDPIQLNMPNQTVKIACADVPDGVVEHMMNPSPNLKKAPHVQIEMTPPPVSLQIVNEMGPDSEVKKPERSPKKKNEEDPKKKVKEQKDEEKSSEPEKSRFSKFGIRVLPDLGLGFGKKGNSPDRETEKIDEKSEEKKVKPNKKDKSKGKDTREPSPTKTGSTDQNSEIQMSMTTSQESVPSEESDETKLKSKRDEENKQQTSDRPPSADSTGSHGDKSSKRSGFHMPNIGIKLFGHSKQYNLEPEKDAKNTGDSSMSEIPSPSTKEEGSMPEVKVRRIEDTEIEAEMDIPHLESPNRKNPDMTIEIHETTLEIVTPPTEAKGGESKKGSSEPLPDEKEDEKRGDKDKGPGFMSKGIQSLRDFKDKVTHKLSAHDSPSSSSDGEGEDSPDKGRKAKKEHRDRSADAKLKEKLEKEEKAKEKAREKERMKAEKRTKKEELKLKKKLSASKETTDSSSSDDTEEDMQDPSQKKVKTKRSKSKDKGKQKKGNDTSGQKLSSLFDADRIVTDDVELDLTHVTTQGPPKMTPAKPPVVPRKSKESLKQKDSSSDLESPSKKLTKGKKSQSSSSGSSSSESENEGKDKGTKPKKPKRSTKRKAPVPPTPALPEHMITTSVEVITHNVNVHKHSAPEIVEATVKSKIQTEKLPINSLSHVQSIESTRVKSPDSGRSASYGDLSNFQSPTKHKMDPLDRAASMDLNAESGNQETHISIMSPVDDLRNTTDSNTAILHYKPRETLESSSSSSSSETLKASPASIVMASPKPSIESLGEIKLQQIKNEAAMILTTAKLKAESQLNQMKHDPLTHDTLQMSQSQVTISTSGSSVLEQTELEAIARDTVDEVITKVNGMEDRITKEKPEKKPSKIPVSKQSSLKNVTVMNILDEVKPIKVDVQMEKQDVTNARPPTAEVSVDVGANVNRPKLLRDDSKSRLMQTVADANDIKMSPVSPGVRKDSSGSSSSISSTSSQSSPDIRVDLNPSFTEPRKTNGTANVVTAPVNGRTIEISASELDGIMMSHSDFLSKQASSVFTPESPPKDSSFDNWVYVDQKHSQSHSTSPSEPSVSSHDDDEDSGIQYSRNGALSPTTFKMETEYGASELKVTTCAPSMDSNPKQTKVYSTTMTLPQKTITQIVLSPEAGQNISVVDGNFIVSKSNLDMESEQRSNSGISGIPVLKH